MYKSSWKISKPADAIKIGTVFFGGAWFVGSLVFLSYCIQIGFLPPGLSIADSIYFSWLMLIFLLCYAFMGVFFFCLGTVLLYWISRALIARGRSDRSGYHYLFVRDWESFAKFDDSLRTVAVYGASLVAIFFILIRIASAQDWSYALSLFVVPLAIVIGLRTYVLAQRQILRKRRRIAHLLTDNVAILSESKRLSLRKLRKGYRKHRAAARAGLVIAFAAPLGLGLFPGLNVAAMTFIHVREPKATVLIREDLCPAVRDQFARHFVDHPYGGYCELTDMAILMSGLGEQTVVSESSDTKHFMPLPSSEVISSVATR